MELAIQDFIVKYLDDKYIQPPPFDLRACYNDSSVISPLIFVLSSGRCSTVGRVDGVEGWVSRVKGMNCSSGSGRSDGVLIRIGRVVLD